MDIQTLISNGQRKLAEQEELARQNEAKEEEARERKRLILVNQFMLDVRAVTPDALQDCIAWNGSDEFFPDYEEKITLSVPECSDIYFYMNRVFEPRPDDPDASDYVWKPRTPMNYFISIGDRVEMDWEIDQFIVKSETVKTEDVEIALAWAYQAKTVDMELSDERDFRNAKRLPEQAEVDTTHDRAQVLADARELEAHRKRESLIAAIANDPVWFELARLALTIQTEREKWEAQLNAVRSSMSDLESHYESKLQRVTERASQSARDAECVKSEASEARDDADRAEKKLKQAQRGW